MATLSLRFVNLNQRFRLCATVVGTEIRHYKVIKELENPDMTHWDKETQKFFSRSLRDKRNNEILENIRAHYQELQDKYDFPTGKELFGFQRIKKTQKSTSTKASKNNEAKAKEKTKAKTVPPSELNVPASEPITMVKTQNTEEYTLRGWLLKIIEDIKSPSRLKPSATYQAYLTLLTKLESEGTLLNQPLSAFNDDSFVHLIEWMRKQKGKNGKGNNYIGIMKIFTATLNRARKARLIMYTPNFPYMEYAPIHKITEKASDFLTNGGAIRSLTEAQYQQFVSMDLSTIKVGGGAVMEYYKQLYRDFCMLLYEMKSRPIDILRLHWDNIAFDPTVKRYTCTYIPAKKKNYGASGKRTSKALVVQYLTPEAVRIIMKYKGKSKGGYVFPFSLNQRRWDFDKPEDFHYHYYKGNHICGRINKFLHRVGDFLKVPFQLTLYAFRRTAITHAITENKMPIAMIAKTAGTSVEMIEAHYTNYLHALAAY